MTIDLITLPRPVIGGCGSFEQVLSKRRTRRSFQLRSLTIVQLSQLLWAAQGITDRANGYRTTPSGAAVYPLVVYAVIGQGGVTEVACGLYRHDVQSHTLTLITAGDLRESVVGSMFNHDWVAEAPVNLIICARYDPMLEKFGRMGTRYTDMEVGHMAENICLQAEALGVGVGLVAAFDGSKLRDVLCVPAEEDPVYSLPVGYAK